MGSEAKHSPTPWRAMYCGVYRADKEERIATCVRDSLRGYQNDGIAMADAAYIVEAVNAYERLREENETLRIDASDGADYAELLKGILETTREDNARLRELVRKMGDEMDDMENCLIIVSAIAGTTRDADSEARCRALLAEARAALGEEAGNG